MELIYIWLVFYTLLLLLHYYSMQCMSLIGGLEEDGQSWLSREALPGTDGVKAVMTLISLSQTEEQLGPHTDNHTHTRLHLEL